MGASTSKVTSRLDIATSFVTDVVISVTNKFTTSVNGTQSISVRCDPDVFTTCSNNCARATLSLLDKYSPQEIGDYTPDACKCCSATNISQSISVSITTNDINDNKIATQIQSELSKKLEEQLESSSSGNVGYGKSETDALTNIKTYVDTDFDFDIVNETLREFNFDQKVDVVNGYQSDNSQTTVATLVASNVVQNAMDTSSVVKDALDALLSAKSTQSGALDNLEGMFDSLMGFFKSGIFLYVMIGIIALVIFVVVFKTVAKNPLAFMKPSGKRPKGRFANMMSFAQRAMPSYSPQYGPSPQYDPQQYDPSMQYGPQQYGY